MFDLDLKEQTKIEILLINWTASIIPNSEIISVKGNKEIIYNWLSDGRFLKKVDLDFEQAEIKIFKDINGVNYIAEIIPIKSGSESLIYHGTCKPSLNEFIIVGLGKDKNNLRILSRLSSSSSNDSCCHSNYFDSVNDSIKQLVADLNASIDECNKMIDKCCKQFADHYEELYKNNPEFLGVKR